MPITRSSVPPANRLRRRPSSTLGLDPPSMLLLLGLAPLIAACGPGSPTAESGDGETCLEYAGNCFIAEIVRVDGTHTFQDPLFDAEFMLPVAHPTEFGTTPTSFAMTAIDFPDGDGLRRSIIFSIHAPEVVPRRFDIPAGSDQDPYVVGVSYVEGDGPSDPRYNLFKADALAGGSGWIEIKQWYDVKDNWGELEFTAVNTVGGGGSVRVKATYRLR